MFADVNSINYYLQSETNTVALFKRIHEKDPALARQAVIYARNALAKHREYELAAAYIADPQADFDSIVQFWKDDLSRAASAKEPEKDRRSAAQRFVSKASQLIEILAGAGLDTIFLLSPTTTDARIARAAALGRGFLYGISRLGVTGARDTVASGAEELVRRSRLGDRKSPRDQRLDSLFAKELEERVAELERQREREGVR